MSWIPIFVLIQKPIFETKISKTINFLNKLENSENPFYINIFKFGDFEEINGIIKSLKSPNILLNNESAINYLNHQRFPNILTLKYYFNRNFMAIILTENLENIVLRNLFLDQMIGLSRSFVIIIITQKFDKNYQKILELFYNQIYTNVIYLDIENFEKYEKFFTFELFPNFKVFSSSNFKKENISNIKLRPLKLICNNYFPVSYCGNVNNKTFTAGRIFNLMENFIIFLNGTVEILIEYQKEYTPVGLFLDKTDFWTYFEINNFKYFLRYYPLITEIESNILESMKVIVVVPKAGNLDHKFYVLKPFSLGVWILCLGYLLFGTSILYLTFVVIKKSFSFWLIFDQLIRTLIAQSFSIPISGILLSTIYLMVMLLGFVITTWYSSILGSFITTNLKESQIRTLDDLRKFNISILSDDINIEYTMNFDEIKDLVSIVSKEEFAESFGSNKFHGYVFSSMYLAESVILEKYFVLENFYLEASFVKVVFKAGSIYKQRFDRY